MDGKVVIEYRKRVVLAGGSGFLGKALAEEFQRAGYGVVILSRKAGKGVVEWDGKTVGAWKDELEGAMAVINLAGIPITTKWTEEGKQKIISSRVEPTLAICEAIQACALPPKLWVNTSAVGIYGDRGEEELTESSAPGPMTDFMPKCCAEWENAALDCPAPVKRAIVRVGVVLGHGGGAYDILSKLARRFLGGSVGAGKMYMSWIHLADLCALFRHVVEGELEGTFNASAPNPVTNAEFMKTLRQSVGRPWSPPVPPFALRLVTAVGGPESTPLLQGQRAIPANALASEFTFAYPEIKSALAQLASGK